MPNDPDQVHDERDSLDTDPDLLTRRRSSYERVLELLEKFTESATDIRSIVAAVDRSQEDHQRYVEERLHQLETLQREIVTTLLGLAESQRDLRETTQKACAMMPKGNTIIWTFRTLVDIYTEKPLGALVTLMSLLLILAVIIAAGVDINTLLGLGG